MKLLILALGIASCGIGWGLRWKFYRPLMKSAHRFNWHHAPVFGPISGDSELRWQRWCQWCGLRQSYSYDPRQPIPGPLKPQTGAHQ